MIKVRKRLIDFFLNGEISKDRYQQLIMADGNKPDSPYKEKNLRVSLNGPAPELVYNDPSNSQYLLFFGLR